MPSLARGIVGKNLRHENPIAQMGEKQTEWERLSLFKFLLADFRKC